MFALPRLRPVDRWNRSRNIPPVRVDVRNWSLAARKFDGIYDGIFEMYRHEKQTEIPSWP
jgi:hypothetical protein